MLSLPFNEKSLRDPFASFNPAQLCGVLYEHNYYVAWGFFNETCVQHLIVLPVQKKRGSISRRGYWACL